MPPAAPDGRTDLAALLAGGGRPYFRWLAQGGVVASFSGDGRTVLTVGGRKPFRLWSTPPPGRDRIDQLVLWSQVGTGGELDEAGNVRPLDGDQWRECRRRLAAAGDPRLP
jgi:hypothetical protein